MLLSSPADFLFKTFCLKKKHLKEYHKSVSQYGSRSSPAVGWASFRFKLFLVVSRQHSTAVLAKKPV